MNWFIGLGHNALEGGLPTGYRASLEAGPRLEPIAIGGNEVVNRLLWRRGEVYLIYVMGDLIRAEYPNQILVLQLD